MKRTVSSIAAAFIMLTSFSSFAAEKSGPTTVSNSKTLVNNYVAATTLGQSAFTKDDLTKDFSYENATNGDRYGKKAYSHFIQKNKGLTYDCTANYEILTETAEVCTAKATMQFANFTRVDLITLTHSTAGWKVAKVVTTYP